MKKILVILIMLSVILLGCAAASAEGILGEVIVDYDGFPFPDGLRMTQGDLLDLNGHSVNVFGDLVQEGGTIILNGGTLNVMGSYSCTGSTSTLTMDNENDLMVVKGDFFYNAWYPGTFTAGTLFVSGNFIQQTAHNAGNFNPSAEHLTVLDGTQNQVVSFGDPACTFGAVQFTNTDITLRNHFGWKKLTTDITAQSEDASLVGTLDLAEHTLYFDGNMGIGHVDSAYAGDIDLNGGQLSVTGNVTHRRGSIAIHGGTLEIGGGYEILGPASSLNMTGEADTVRIGGDMYFYPYYASELTAGTLYLGGGFTQRTTNNAGTFQPAVEHVTVLNGTNTQLLQFGDASCGFGTLKAENDQLAFAQNVSWKLLDSDLTAASPEGCTLTGTMDLNGHTVTIDGDAGIQATLDIHAGKLSISGNSNHAAGQVTLNGGTLEIGGGYEVQGSSASLMMANENDVVRVGGDMYFHPYYASTFTAGTLYVAGNFTQRTANNARAFNPAVEHVTILNGTGPQVIQFGDASCTFGTLKAENDQLVFAQNIAWKSLGSNITASSPDGCTFNNTMDLNGCTAVINGNVNHTGYQVAFNGGTLEIGGDYHIQGSSASILMNNENDVLRVKGNFYFHPNHSSTLLAGTMYFGGNVTVWIGSNSGCFKCGSAMRAVLDGNRLQTISVRGGNSFNILKLTRPKECYVFIYDNVWKELIVPEVPVLLLPADLTEIDAEAFAGDCSIQFVSLTTASQLSSIGAGAFRDCANLMVICLPEGVSFLAEDAFDGCEGLVLSGCNEYAAAYAQEHGIDYTGR